MLIAGGLPLWPRPAIVQLAVLRLRLFMHLLHPDLT